MVFKLDRIERIREYEMVFITKPEISDEELAKVKELFENVVKDHAGEVLKTTVMGKRKLFYEVKGTLRGLFLYSTFTGNNKLITELERRLRINENVIRYQTIKLDSYVKDIEAKRAFYKSEKFEDSTAVLTKAMKEVKDDYDKFKPQGV